ncbi:hypothetical protein GH784_23530 [Agrobacterium sp. CNPSo 675]|nr:hypothetical protein [Agrobacterium tumefaciens]
MRIFTRSWTNGSRIDAHLVLDKLQGARRSCYQLGGSAFTTPRVIAAHYGLAVALARMLDKTGLTGQTTFTAESDLTAQWRNAYSALPDLSRHSGRLKRALSKVSFPEAMMAEARDHMEKRESNLPLNREVEIMAALLGKRTSNRSPWPMLCSGRDGGKTNPKSPKLLTSSTLEKSIFGTRLSP